MAVKIRLSRRGAKKRPFYHVVAADERAPRDGKFIEKLGTYDPMIPADASHTRLKVNAERFKYWVDNGAQLTDKVKRLSANIGLSSEYSFNPQTSKDKPKKKAQEMIAAKAKAAEAAKAASAAPKEEPSAGAE